MLWEEMAAWTGKRGRVGFTGGRCALVLADADAVDPFGRRCRCCDLNVRSKSDPRPRA